MTGLMISIIILVALAICIAAMGILISKWYSDALREAEGYYTKIEYEEKTSLDGKKYYFPKEKDKKQISHTVK